MSNQNILVTAMLDELRKLAEMGIQKNPNSVMGGNIKITAPGKPKPMPNHMPSATAPKLPASQVIGPSNDKKNTLLTTSIIGGK